MSDVELAAEIAELRAALVARDWARCRAVAGGVDPRGRTDLLIAASQAPAVEDFLAQVLAADPDDAPAAAMLAFHRIHVGSGIRSGYRAQHVSAQQFERFHDWLRRAELVLIEAVAREPGDPALWVARLMTARGLGLGLAETRRRYDRLAGLDPQHLPGQLQLLQSLCPKWHGSWEQAHDFAREVMLAAPPGSPNAVVVAQLHVEHWMDGERRSHLNREAVREEIHEAAKRSVWHPDFARTPGWVTAANTFAFLFSEMRDQRSAAAMFTLLGSYGLELPWGHLGEDAQAVVRQRRAEAGVAAR